MTASQNTVDGVSKSRRSGRGCHNIIPASTGAAVALHKVLPELQGKLIGTAYRVPCDDVSLLDLCVRLRKPASLDDVIAALREAERGEMRGVLRVCDDEPVSSDMRGEPASCVVDAQA
jgi:glyceraldehyde 3-phosphate dehydrogenase